MSRLTLLIGLLFCASVGGRAAPQFPPTQPAEAEKVEELRQAYAALASPDPSVRGRAHGRLVSLKREDLPRLAQAVRELRPLDPVMFSALKEIVMEVHAAGDAYEKDPIGFLGIRMERGRDDVLIASRMLGFVGHRVLQDGDLIVGIEERPLPQDGFQARFMAAVKQLKPGETVRLSVLRHGQPIQVVATLDARPLDKSGGTDPNGYDAQIYEMLYRRAQEAEEYWARQFAPLLETGIKPQAAAR